MGVKQESLGLFQMSEHDAAEIVKKRRVAQLVGMRATYEAKAQKIRQKYQETGSGALKPAEDAEDIVDVIDMALRQVEDDGREYLRRRQNIDGLIGRLGKETYSRDEVAKMLRESIEV